MNITSLFTADDPKFNYAITHVFFPPALPEKSDFTLQNEFSFARAVSTAAHAYSAHVDDALRPRWHYIARMLDNLQASLETGHIDKDYLISRFGDMELGDILVFFIRSQHAGVIFRRRDDCTLYESFEASPNRDAVMRTGRRLLCSYAGTAIEIPNTVFDDAHFRTELANFLSLPGDAGSYPPEYPPGHPGHITTLLTGILRSIGHIIEGPHVLKRVGDEVGDLEEKENSWRRSPLWLLIRVAIQTSFDRSPPGRASYKEFILFFICNLANDANDVGLDSNLLHLMSVKILRRLSKLGSSAPNWLSNMVMKTCARLQDTLDLRTMELQATKPKPYWNPSELDLVGDTQLSLPRCSEYVRNVLADADRKSPATPFHPKEYYRGTLEDFLLDKTFFDKAYNADPYVALYDVELSVQKGIDHWVAHVTSVDEACMQLVTLMDAYLSCGSRTYLDNPELQSIMALTALEMWVALDTLVVAKIPMLSEYSPEIPASLLESLLLREATNLQRLSRVYLYLSNRRSMSRAGLSVWSNEFTEDSFSVRYYDNSHDLQALRHRMEEKTISKGPESGKEHETLALTFRDVIFCQQDGYSSHGEFDKGAESTRSLVSVLSSHIKVICFELQCPLSFRVWRSVTLHLLYRFDRARVESLAIDFGSKSLDLLHDIPEMQPYLAEHSYCRISACSQLHLAFCHSKGHDLRMGPRLCYAFSWIHLRDERSRWCGIGEGPLSQLITYYNILGDINNHRVHRAKNLAKYVGDTIHTSNDVLASQSDCHSDFSLDEFIACGHLRSGGSLQWLNILRQMRGRTLNFYSHEIYFTLAQATSQVGPLDVNTREWVWHQELQDPSFCNALLNELEILFLDASTSSLDEVTMRTISMLLTRILASSPCEDLMERTLCLLRDVRRKTLTWVRELAYNLIQAPTDGERRQVLYKMATTCRSTFDVSAGLLHRVIDSAEDVEALLACAFFIQATNHFSAFPKCGITNCHDLHFGFSDIHDYSRLLHQRDCRLSVAVEGMLRDTIKTEVTGRGIDLAIRNAWPGYRPGPKRWKPEDPNSHWLVCATSGTSRHPQNVRINLLDGSLLVDSQPVAGLPCEIRVHPLYRGQFSEGVLHIVPSDLPRMDFVTLGMIDDRFIHFSLRHEDLVIRAHHRDTTNILQLIPPDQLKGELPTCLIENHNHWFNLATSTIYIRSITGEPDWEIVGAPGQYRVCKDSESMVDMKSRTWAMVSGLLKGLEDPENLIITVSTADSSHAPRLSIAIPRHGLSFFLTMDGDLESEDFRGMIYDENQDIGTLFGLDSRLVLRGKVEFQEGFVPRCVLIPPHRFPELNRFAPTYHVYRVDTELGRLVGPDFGGKQFLLYLHAKTSIDWRPDPLTAKTGAQEALSIVTSADYQSIRATPFTLANNAIYHFPENTFPWYPQITWIANPEIFPATYGYLDSKRMRATSRAEYLFPHSDATRTFELPGGSDDMRYLSSFTDLELEDLVHTAALLVRHRLLDAPRSMSIALKWSKIWGDSMSRDDIQSPSPYDGVVWNPDLPRVFPAKVHDIFKSPGHDNNAGQQFCLLFLFPTRAYCSSHPQTAFLSMFLAFAKQERYLWVNYTDYHLLGGYSPTRKVLQYHIHGSQHLHPNETKINRTVWHNVDAVVECLLDSWPSNTIPAFTLDPGVWDVEGLTLTLRALFSSCYRNWKLMQDLTRVLQVPHPQTRPRAVLHMDHLNFRPSHITPGLKSQSTSAQVHTAMDHHISHTFPSLLCFFPHQHSWRVTLDKLLSERHAPSLSHSIKPPLYKSYSDICLSRDAPELDRLLSCLPTQMNGANPPFMEQYITDLHASARHVREEHDKRYNKVEKYPIRELEECFVQCKGKYMDALRRFEGCLGPTDDFEQVLVRCGQWPQITSQSLLKCLASTSTIKLSDDWRHCLSSFALLLLEFQRSRRLLRFALEGLEEEFVKEFELEGCDGRNAEQYPDWLLLQLQGNFIVRSDQASVALEMISPQSEVNTVMQVNMGEGKSSVIIPIVAAALADGHQLVRVIVPKGLMDQMWCLLSERLGGLVNRRVYRIPFARFLNSQKFIDIIYQTMSRCMEERGILLVQPEDVLSLKLTSIESQFTNTKPWQTRRLPDSTHEHHVVMAAMSLKHFKNSYLATVMRALCDLRHSATGQLERADSMLKGAASRLLDLQKLIHSRARDILDESDEILHVRHQLIYAIGDPQHMEGYPDRWTVIQKVLRLVKRHASSLSKDLPHLVDCGSHEAGSFPHLRILRNSDAGPRLISLLVKDVMDGRLSGFDFRFIDQTRREAIRRFLSVDGIGPDIAKEVEGYAKNSRQKNLWNGLLLLRGLFASNILLFCFTERRWRVDYGLIPKRFHQYSACTKLAIPYQAKDVPALDAQFGHPDITILLTCLSYYYTGLGEDELRLSFQTLQRQDNPAVAYVLWVQEHGSASLPASLQTLRELNLEPSEQWDNEIFPTFAYNQATIDFYLSHIVFPKEAKEYPWRLTASSWDLAEKRERLITGFSGTNDSRYLLPTTISPWELDHQQGSSAQVLAYLLQQENDSYAVIAGKSENDQLGRTSKILEMISGQEPGIHVLLDVGAQIMDVSNEELASDWLDLTSAAGAVYFDEDDRLMVRARNGKRQTLLSSSLAERLDRCVIYLDHAHTRGTDLKFPNGFRAAVTLGPKVTKDRLVQGCMRMRKLGRGHSVMFFAPLEVDRSIRSITHKEDRNIQITTADILKWAIHETWTDIQQRAPQWAQQGMSYKRRCDAWSHFCNNEITSEKMGDAWLESETKSLSDLYAPHQVQKTPDSAVSTLEKDIYRHCETLGVAKSSINSAQLDEQVERQVNREIERERQVELPPKAEPAEHSLHPDVRTFVTKGTLRASKAFRPVFTNLEQSSVAAVANEIHDWSPFILATADFCETIKQIPTYGRVDQYLRPVQWILSGKKRGNRVLVILSPYEANVLIPDIRVSKHVHLHIYTPRTSWRMKSTDDLMLYTIPPVPEDWIPPWDLIDQLNIFAGQLYLTDWDAYTRLTHFLDLRQKDKAEGAARFNLFNFGSTKDFENAHSDSLLPSVMMLLAMRRKGLPFSETHMGKILQGRSLTKEDFIPPSPAEPSDDGALGVGVMQLSVWSGGASYSSSDVDCQRDGAINIGLSEFTEESRKPTTSPALESDLERMREDDLTR